MSLPARHLAPVVSAARLPAWAGASPEWGFATLAGRFVELSADGAPAALSAALFLVRDAQRLGETTAWITPTRHHFFPPDAAAAGVDLGALVVVRVPAVTDVPRAADRLLRSGAFGLVVGDLWTRGSAPAVVPMALQSRLVGLAQTHHAVACCLTTTPSAAPSLGSLVSLRVVATRSAAPTQAGFTLTLTAVKDKRCAPGWNHVVATCHGPAGLR